MWDWKSVILPSFQGAAAESCVGKDDDRRAGGNSSGRTFSALDSYLKDVLQRDMVNFLQEYKGDMILVTHSRDEAYKFCEELTLLKDGSVLVTERRRRFLRIRSLWRLRV